MSNKPAPKQKRGLTPKLRFPEFRDAGEWEVKKLGDFATISTGSSNREDSSLVGSYTFFDRSQDIRTSDIFLFDCEAIIVAGEGQEFIPKYFIGKFDLHQRTYAIMNFGDVLGKYLYYHTYYFRHYFLSQAVGSTVKSLRLPMFQKMPVHLPTLAEQRKIAECLTSLDDLIAAHSQKLDALRAHKKGLLQQLFPAPGESTPRLRFPEFREKWVQKRIQNLIDEGIITGHLDGNHGALYPRAEEFSKDGVPYISANDFVAGFVDFDKCKYLPMKRAMQFKKGVAKDGDILFAHNATVGPVAKLNTNLQFVILSTTATYFRCNNKYLINDFLKFALSSPSFVDQYTRVMSQSTRNQVPITTQRKFNLQLPSVTEQQKIADCLTTLDDLIAAQNQKIDALKAHKKGLLQQLFPSHEKV